MSFRSSGLGSRRESRLKRSRNQVAAKERARKERLDREEGRLGREIREAEQWAKDNPPPKLPPPVRIRIAIPGLPTKSFTVSRFTDGKILVGNQVTTPKQFGRKLGVLLDQFIP